MARSAGRIAARHLLSGLHPTLRAPPSGLAGPAPSTPCCPLQAAAPGVLATAIIERLALAGFWIDSWTYSAAMPIVPGIGVGLSPLLQWGVLPPLVVWFVKRQIRRV